MTTVEPRLYGLPGAEVMHSDPATVYEGVECDREEDDRSPVLIEEWSVAPTDSHIPTAERILDWIVEDIGENGMMDEYGYDAFNNAAGSEEVVTAVEAVRKLLASRVTYYMAETHLRTLTVTFDDAEAPLLDGQPMYVTAAGQATTDSERSDPK